jgi:hydrogenase maturation protease
MKRVVVAIGNRYRGDDGLALAAAERLAGHVPDGVEIVPCEQEPTRLIDAWHGAAAVVVVDAVEAGAKPGTLHRFDASEAELPARVFRSSTHVFGVGEAIELARALGKLPARVVVLGVEGSDFTAREGLSAPVESAVDDVARAVLDELKRMAREERCTSER